MNTLEFALIYADMGWAVIPLWGVGEDGRCLCGRNNCSSPGKHPNGKYVPRGVKEATTDGTVINKWFGNGAILNIGICTGRESELLVLDVDDDHGGNESLVNLEDQYGAIDTLMVLTGRGKHLYFQNPDYEVKNSVGKLGDGLDIRTDNGYVVAPPSLHTSGTHYAWKHDPKEKKPTPCPEWILSKNDAIDCKTNDIADSEEIFFKGKRNSRLTSIAGLLWAKGVSEEALLIAVKEINWKCCRPPLEDSEVEQIVRSVTNYPASQTPNKNQATLLVDLAGDANLFHDSDARAYATIKVNGHRENLPVKSRKFRRWLGGRYWKQYHAAPGSQAMQDALGALEAKALYEGKEHSVHIRLAECNGAIWLDPTNPKWQAIKITPDGWQLIDNPPVKFLRPRGLQSLPTPSDDGDVGHLRKVLNLANENDWILIVCWLVACLNPKGPYPILVVNGEQGSAKSTLCRLVKRILDPNISALRATPREVRDLMIAAANGWVVSFDNLSHIPSWLSDALCRLATGGGFSTRELYTDGEEIIFDAKRPVVINGISELATRSDLLDRSICVTLPPVPDGKRKTEKQLYREFEALLPQILGGLLDAVSAAMKKLPSVDLKSPPRMADFAAWSVAAEEGLGLVEGSFMTAYTANRESATDLAIEVCPVAPALMDFMTDRDRWEGTAQELLDELEHEDYTAEKTRKRKDWPKSPQGIGRALRRLAPNIRRTGINIHFNRDGGKDRKRQIILEKVCKLMSETSETSDTPPDNAVINIDSDMSDISDNKIQDDSCLEDLW